MTTKERYEHDTSYDNDATRRRFLVAAARSLRRWALRARGEAQELAPTPACDDHGAATLRQGEGPFFKPLSPERADLREQGAPGRPVELVGAGADAALRPLVGAVVDLLAR